MSGNTFTKYTKYTVKELESYVADPGTCVQKLEWKDLVSVLPKYLGNICDGVKACLTQKIGTYDRKVDGVILAFKNTQILSPLSAIRPNSVRAYVKLKTDFYVFRPQIGATIEGTVRYVSSNYLSAVIYRVFNVTIKLTTQKMQQFARGTVISFIVKAFDMKSDLPFIEGQLISKSGDNNPVTNGVVKTEKTSESESQVRPEQTDFDTMEAEVHEENSVTKIKVKIADDSVSGKKGSKRKRTKLNGQAAKNGVQSDEDMELSIHALLTGLEKEMSDAIESDPSTSGVELHKKTNQSVEETRPLKKKKKKKLDIDSLEAELLQKFAAQCVEPEQPDLQIDTSGLAKNDQIATPKSEKVKKAKKKKNKAPKLEEDDFEASIMSSILKCVAEADEPQKQTQTNDSTPSKNTGKIVRKSVRFDNTITEASFNAFDSSELLEISQLQSPALSSTLKGNEQK